VKRVFEVLGIWFELKDSPDKLYADNGLPIGSQRAMDDHILWIAPGMSTEDREQAIAVGVSGIIRDLLQSSSGGSPRLLPVHELPPS
jgi:hypothetical protein